MTCNNCTTPEAPETAYDCQAELRGLYEAYKKLAQGRNSVVIEHKDQRVEYGRGNIQAVANLYNALYVKCGAGTDLPEKITVTGSVVRRGPAVRSQYYGC